MKNLAHNLFKFAVVALLCLACLLLILIWRRIPSFPREADIEAAWEAAARSGEYSRLEALHKSLPVVAVQQSGPYSGRGFVVDVNNTVEVDGSVQIDGRVRIDDEDPIDVRGADTFNVEVGNAFPIDVRIRP